MLGILLEECLLFSLRMPGGRNCAEKSTKKLGKLKAWRVSSKSLTSIRRTSKTCTANSSPIRALKLLFRLSTKDGAPLILGRRLSLIIYSKREKRKRNPFLSMTGFLPSNPMVSPLTLSLNSQINQFQETCTTKSLSERRNS